VLSSACPPERVSGPNSLVTDLRAAAHCDAAITKAIMTQPDVSSDACNDVSPGTVAQRTCTASQLRRFIRSRPYVPIHELRRRFELNGEADDVCRIETPDGPRKPVPQPRACPLARVA
jgi:hypothetical protein